MKMARWLVRFWALIRAPSGEYSLMPLSDIYKVKWDQTVAKSQP